MSHNILTLRNVETYYGPILAIKGVSLDVQEGKIVTILGANGAGKTTILKTLCGAMDPQKGKVKFLGKEIQKQDPDKVARQGIAHVPEGREVFPLLSVHDNLMMGAYGRKDKKSINDDLEIVYDYFPVLRERTKQKAGFLSGGQQQMLVLGRAMMARPKLMLLDEPSLGLSPLFVQDIFGIIRRLNKEQQMTMLLVEQNANMALKNGDYGYVLENGRIVMEDTCSNLMASDDIKEFYMGIKDEGTRGKRRWKKRKTWR
ncbi:MAG: ABC transporter ATP-binding protein [Deltaproteobacteria bacterium]|jgi:branched-chain amino acid transport system ATP-binding protein|nr:ABC transporter ATP-binding protein [Deltaproteobacteria bacterium]MBT4641122.1 ABC transporter ATP-binding protein [Deltaproteobacteria bacterium]MBT6504996.1 ABC transporter ATP-binding protein [Deltaproteobacteria bacterium]MBT6615795.1 ABC transporter ATP-binding protein [Deltaproteobacteria bacterium]MBT7155088.1 ABC transporter ATP-binding protein [Deltaproteobacteria bacterium]